jgi:hypothetical protein
MPARRGTHEVAVFLFGPQRDGNQGKSPVNRVLIQADVAELFLRRGSSPPAPTGSATAT